MASDNMGTNSPLIPNNTMQAVVSFPTEHKDLVHYVAYDFYGERLATCSSDHTVRVWKMENGQWVLADELKVRAYSPLTADAPR